MIGISSYAYLWRGSDRMPAPLSVDDMLRDAHDHGLTLFQLCDHPWLDAADHADAERLRRLAESLGIRLELGTRGVRPPHLRRFIDLAGRLEAGVIRSMTDTAEDRPGVDEVVDCLAEIAGELEAGEVTLALETYELRRTTELVAIVERVGSPRVGICLDPGNCVAALEHPDRVVDLAAPHVRNLHVKDFAFTRRDGTVGFTLAGTKLGEGLLDYERMLSVVRPAERGINQIIEHWLPWQDAETTARREAAWVSQAIDVMHE